MNELETVKKMHQVEIKELKRLHQAEINGKYYTAELVAERIFYNGVALVAGVLILVGIATIFILLIGV